MPSEADLRSRPHPEGAGSPWQIAVLTNAVNSGA